MLALGKAAALPIVIIGGGPVGLAASLLLSREGVKCVVVERRTTPSSGQSRAVTIQRDIVALYDRLKIAGEIVELGSSWSVGRTYFQDEEILQVTFGDDASKVYPPFINFAQYRVEELLHRAVLSDGRIEMVHGASADVVDDGTSADHAVVRIVDGSGQARTVDASYVIAADGVGSSTRKSLGIDFEGWRTNGRFLVADFRARVPFKAERRLWFSPPFYPDGIVLMHNIGGDIWRLDWQIPSDLNVENELATGGVIRRIRDVLDHAGVGRTAIEVLRCNGWTFQQRQATRFRQGRVFLAGDAAHVVSPFGARGMNSGMEDADNLAWKLVRVSAGTAPEALLDSYAEERGSAAAHHVHITGESMKFMTPGTAEGLRKRNKVLAEAAADPAKAHLVNSGRLYEPHPYPDSSLTTAGPQIPGLPRAGELIPDFRVTLDGFPITLRKMVGGRFTAIRTDPAKPDTLGCYAVDDAGVTGQFNLKADPTTPLHHANSVAYLVRPDCYLAAVQEITDEESWLDGVRAAWYRAMAREPKLEASIG